jgi:hypothetical protein
LCGEENWGAGQLQFEMFLFYWLSALFVLVEGFKKLKLKDDRVQKARLAHIAIHERLEGKVVDWMEHVSDERQ